MAIETNVTRGEVELSLFTLEDGHVKKPRGRDTLHLDPVSDTESWELDIELLDRYTAPSGCAIVFQGKTWKLSGALMLNGENADGIFTFWVNPRQPLDIKFVNFPDEIIEMNINIHRTNTAPITGVNRIRLLAYTATVDLTPQQWSDITDIVASIDISKGIDANRITSKGTVGTLTASLLPDDDTFVNYIPYGTPLIVQDIVTRERLFTGATRSLTLTPDKKGKYTAKIEACDYIDQLSKMQPLPEDGAALANYEVAITSLLLKCDVPFKFLKNYWAAKPEDVFEIRENSSMSTHLDIYAASCGAVWYVDSYGRVVIDLLDKNSMKPDRNIAIDSNYSFNGEKLDPTDIRTGLNFAEIITAVEINNKYITAESTKTQTKTLLLENTNLVKLYGKNVERIETCGNMVELKRFYKKILAAQKEGYVISSADFNLYSYWDYIDRRALQDALITTDTGTGIMTAYKQHIATMRVSHVSHHITPYTWDVSLQLAEIPL